MQNGLIPLLAVCQASKNSWSLVSRYIQIKCILLFFRNFCHVNYGLLRALYLPVCSDTDETEYENPAQHFLYESLKVYNSIHFLKIIVYWNSSMYSDATMFYLELNKEFPSKFLLQSNNATSFPLVALFSLMQQVWESVWSLMTRT